MTGDSQIDSKEPPCILIVDDHDLVRSLLVEILVNAKYRVIEADSGPVALKLVQQQMADIDCIIQDMSMPVMSGPEIIRQVFELFPEAKILVFSVDDAQTVSRQLGDLPVAGYLEKPCDTNILLQKVAAIVG